MQVDSYEAPAGATRQQFMFMRCLIKYKDSDVTLTELNSAYQFAKDACVRTPL